jgi:hypothetical protein
MLVRRNRFKTWLLAGTICLGLTAAARACPNCKEAVSLQPEETASMARGYNWSVLFMLAVPFSLFGTGAMMVHRAAKKGLLPEM